MTNDTTTLGLDLSTQSLSAVVLDVAAQAVVYRTRIDYRSDKRLRHFGLDPATAIIAAHSPGEANQPPALFLSALECLFADMSRDGFDLGTVDAINASAQQHGHVYLGSAARLAYKALHHRDTRHPHAGHQHAGHPHAGHPHAGHRHTRPLPDIFADSFSYPHAPIWMTANSAPQARLLLDQIGGEAEMVRRSGSASPARFTGAIILRIAQQNPRQYAATTRIHLLSSWLASLMCGDIDTPIDYGNASGTSLQNWEGKRWDSDLLRIMEQNGAYGIADKLPALCSPTHIVGTVAPYLCARYGFRDRCRVLAGSGDNPQSKVLTSGALLSLGSSFVIMAEGAEHRNAATNAMYDGLDRPFLFGCRTNGALVWDRLRTEAGISLEKGEELLARHPPFGAECYVWQPQTETLPISPPYQTPRRTSDTPHTRYRQAVDSALALTAHYSRKFVPPSRSPLSITGGASRSPHILRRCAALWKRPVIAIDDIGAALGAAVAAAITLHSDTPTTSLRSLLAAVVPTLRVIAATQEERTRAEAYRDRLIDHHRRLSTT